MILNGVKIYHTEIYFIKVRKNNLHFNFDLSDANIIKDFFKNSEKQAEMLIENNYSIPAYDYLIHCSHFFNLLDARGVIAITERANYIKRIRNLARKIGESILIQEKS